MLQPVLVEGQVQGGVAQGVGQALLEWGHYDDASGQLVAGSFMDYAMPRAEDLPAIVSLLHPVRCTTNPLGVKGVGEAGTTASLAAVMNAVADAGANIDIETAWRCRFGQFPASTALRSGSGASGPWASISRATLRRPRRSHPRHATSSIDARAATSASV